MEFSIDPATATANFINKLLGSLVDNDFVRARRMGHSVCGRPIMALEIGAMDRPALFVGGTHGMEWASTWVALRLAQEAAAAAKDDRKVHGINLRAALAAQGAVIMPLLNPDGYEIFREGREAALKRIRQLALFDDAQIARWQSNANGVDINHNFNAGFWKARALVRAAGITGPGPTRFGGRRPFSQPESRAARHACKQYQPRVLYALHSQGQEIYWRYGKRIPDNSAHIAAVLAKLTGYRVCQPETLASHAGLKDWFIKRTRRPGFTIELGLGQNPIPYTDFEDIWRRVEQAMFVAMTV